MSSERMPLTTDPDFWAWHFRRAARSSALLQKKYYQLSRSNELRESIWQGACALTEKAREYAEFARQEGQLLRCFY